HRPSGLMFSAPSPFSKKCPPPAAVVPELSTLIIDVDINTRDSIASNCARRVRRPLLLFMTDRFNMMCFPSVPRVVTEMLANWHFGSQRIERWNGLVGASLFSDCFKQRGAIAFPGFFAFQIPRKFQRDRRDLQVDSRPASEAAGGRVSDVVLHGI